MRISVIEVMGALIKLETSGGEEPGNTENTSQIAGLIETILDRMLDTSSYVRAKVLALLSRLWMDDLKGTYAKQRLACVRAAVVALDDKVTTVRKTAITLLVVLMQTHPWQKPFDGDLETEKWDDALTEIRAKVAAMEEILVAAVSDPQERDGEGGGEEEEDEEDDEEEGEGEDE